MGAFVISRLLGLVREIVVANQFGTSADYAAYVAAFRIPDLLFVLVAGGALASAFIPTFSSYLARGAERAGWRLVSAIGTWILLIVGFLAVVLAIMAPAWVQLFKFSPALQALTVHLARIMLVSTVIFSLSGLVMSVLHSYQHFLWPSIAPAFYNLGIIGGAIFLAPHVGVTGLAIGVVIGATAHLLVQLPMLFRYKQELWPQLGLNDAEIAAGVREVVRLMTPRVAGLAVVQLNFVVTTVLATYLAYPAAVSALDYAWKVMLLPQGIFAMAVATAAFPTFSAQVAQDEIEAMQRTLGQVLRAVLFLTLPAAIGLIVLREPIITLLFQRGAFGAASTAAVSWALLFYAPGLVSHSLIEISTRAFYALHDTLTPVLIGAGAMLLNVALSLFLLTRFGVPGDPARGPHGGLALANTIATTLEMVVLLWLLQSRHRGLESRRLLESVVRLGIAALLMGALLVGLSHASPLAEWPIQAVGILGIAVGGIVYVAVAWLLRAEEVRIVPQLVFRR